MKSPAAVLWFRSNGTVRGLYTEVISLAVIGSLQVRRATIIEFNHQPQLWEVRDRDGRMLYASSSRHDCLKWEHQHFTQNEPDG